MIKNSSLKTFYILLIIINFISCEPKKTFIMQVDGGPPPARLAILPANNFSNDVLGGYVQRNLLYKSLKQNPKGYLIQNIKTTNERLINAGITDGALLSAFHPLELCEILDVDGLLYIDIYDMGIKSLPFYNSRYIYLNVRLYNFEKFIWQKVININNRHIDIEGALDSIDNISQGKVKEAFKKAGDSVTTQVIVKLGIATLFEHELKPEMKMVVNKIISVIPRGRSSNNKYWKKVDSKLKELHLKAKNNEELVPKEEKNKIRKQYEIMIQEQGINIIKTKNDIDIINNK
ncbi:putative lipoprotein DUF799 [Hypnocyclicus thermotrophus]|uniref:Lipoprotein DUF799 n=1 Tax=Hypnocyclicus thermotrophus TaxID=1627895 RepID=A0AA46I5Y1_9FUSO|nr:hypothetical protein [Hypnocyclicus thermotrophus]TDT71416.1 putative lipoprotein DUF799 [Hypnocyclicus thermotrophus]